MLGIDDGTGNRARGFPVIAGTVEYPVACYRTIMGWIQTVRVTHADGSAETFVARQPQMTNVDHPFVYWGPQPMFFDAPATTDPPRQTRHDRPATTERPLPEGAPMLF